MTPSSPNLSVNCKPKCRRSPFNFQRKAILQCKLAPPDSDDEDQDKSPAQLDSGKNPEGKMSLSLLEQSQESTTNNKHHEDADLDSNDEVFLVEPPKSLQNCSPYQCQLLNKLVPRHVTVENVMYSHKTKVGGRTLYFFIPAYRGSLSKPVFTTKEKISSLLMSNEDTDDESSSPLPSRKRKDDAVMTGVCSLKRIHLLDPACDLGIAVWRGRCPQKGMRGHQVPPSGKGPALIVEVCEVSNSSKREEYMAVAMGYSGQVMYLIPFQDFAKAELEPRITEIFVEEAMLFCVCESVVWFTVKLFVRRRIAVSRCLVKSNVKNTLTKKISLS